MLDLAKITTLRAQSSQEAQARVVAAGGATDIILFVGGSTETLKFQSTQGTARDYFPVVNPQVDPTADGIQFIQDSLDGISNWISVELGSNYVTLTGENATPPASPLYLEVQFLLMKNQEPVSILTKTVTVLPVSAINNSSGIVMIKITAG